MKKIPCLFVIDHSTGFATTERAVDWVDEAIPTRKWDGTACLIRNGILYKRYDCKRGRTPPKDFEPCEIAPDPITLHWPGWVPIGPHDYWHKEVASLGTYPDGTYELCGPKVNGNPEKLDRHMLLAHGFPRYYSVPTDWLGLRNWLSDMDIEGLVWHHPDGRMCKLRKDHYGFVR